jgi:dihydroxyacetone kinase-like protein
MTDFIDAPILVTFFQLAAQRMEDNRQQLCALDGEIGDGDHGSSMAAGFAAITTRLRAVQGAALPPAALLREASTAFLSEVGATVGPLYATAFLEGAGLLDKGPLPRRNLGDLLAAFAAGIARRGLAELGDKTMLDAWIPAQRAAQTAAATGLAAQDVADAAAEAARMGAETTTTMIASRGRASRLKERSLGHRDPGAVSAALIVGVFAELGPRGA